MSGGTRNKACYLATILLVAGILISACGKTPPAPSQQNPPGQKPPGQSQNQDITAANENLKKLLPAKTGYHWAYQGFAEYSHTMDLQSITSPADGTVYHLTGKVGDPSGGAAKGNFNLTIDYTIKNGTLIQHKAAEKMMDTFVDTELVRTPLEAQKQWEQKVRDAKGQEYQLLCTVTDIKNDPGGKIYTILYKDKNSDLYEKRQLQEGKGVISFEKLMISGTDKIEMGYSLNTQNSGYQQ